MARADIPCVLLGIQYGNNAGNSANVRELLLVLWRKVVLIRTLPPL